MPPAQDEIRSRPKEVTLEGKTQVIGRNRQFGSVSAEIFTKVREDRNEIRGASDMSFDRRGFQVTPCGFVSPTRLKVFEGGLCPYEVSAGRLLRPSPALRKV